MLDEHLLEAREVGAVRRVRDADDPRTMRAQQRLEVEVARVVEHDGVAGLQQQPAHQIERMRAAVGQHDLRGLRMDAVLREAPRELLAQCGQPEWRRIVGQCVGFVARYGAQRAAQALVGQPRRWQPAAAGFHRAGRRFKRLARQPQRIELAIEAGPEFGERERRRMARHVEAGAAPRDEHAFAREPFVRVDDGRFRHMQRVGHHPDRRHARARHQRAARDPRAQRVHHGFHTRARCRGRGEVLGGLAHGEG